MILLDGNSLGFNQIINVVRENEPVALSARAKKNMLASRRRVEEAVKRGEIIYGITTGIGSFAEKVIDRFQAEKLQENILKSHAVGVGEPLPEEIVRACMLLRINALAKGYSGIRIETVQLLVAMLNKGVQPVVPEQGSVGASGDLAPLAHMALPLIGQGEAYYRGKRYSGGKVLHRAGLKPIRLREKEGLALINGTQVMTAIGALALWDAKRLNQCADVAAALSLEALLAKSAPFSVEVQTVRCHPGQKATAENIRRLLKGSTLIDSSDSLTRVQDAYSLRCIPQVHGAVRQALGYVQQVLEIEINSATDNPLIFPESGSFVSAGNFHGQPVALALDHLSIALTTLGNIAERRIAKILDKNHNNGLPPFLVSNGGLNSGLMLLQYTAAALASENKVLCHPASADTIPTSANQEDHVSMGTISARHAQRILRNVEKILAIECLCAYQGLQIRIRDNRQKVTLGKGTHSVFQLFARKGLRRIDEDCDLKVVVDRICALIHNGAILMAAKLV